jgi:hypothetical protein
LSGEELVNYLAFQYSQDTMPKKILKTILYVAGAFLSVFVFNRVWNLTQVKAQELTMENARPCQTIVIGFVGGMRSPEDVTQGVVQIGNRLKSLHQSELQVGIYSHWSWQSAYHKIYQIIDQNRDEKISADEISLAPKIIIYGHSLGGWAVVKLSRKLEKIGIPVELTVQLDSVGPGDVVVPGNVKTAANYYQRTVPILRGEKQISAADENKTNIAGNFLIKDVGHEALARRAEISDFISEKVRQSLVCGATTNK